MKGLVLDRALALGAHHDAVFGVLQVRHRYRVFVVLPFMYLFIALIYLFICLLHYFIFLFLYFMLTIYFILFLV